MLYQINEAEVRIYQVCKELFGHINNVKVFVPDIQFGHMSINAPIIYSKSENKSIDEVYNLLQKSLGELDFVLKIELVRGFCNFTFSDDFIIRGIKQILDLKTNYGSKKRENKIKVNVEYISANPTGDLHLGHIRGIYGDILSRFLKFIGHEVTREYYVNNLGNQIYILGRSVFYEYSKLEGLDFPEPEEKYPGEHIATIAENISNTATQSYSWDSPQDRDFFMQKSVEEMLKRIQEELKILNIEFDVWRYESEVHASGCVESAIKLLEDKGYVKEEILGEVKSKRGKASNLPVKVFFDKSKDDANADSKALTKSDGSYTYFAADLGYHYLKIQEGYAWIIDSFGADHHLHAEMLSEAVPLLEDSCRLTMMIFQVVKFKKGDQELKMSKRGGVTLKPSEVLEHLPDPNILRFVMASKPHDTHFVIDVDKIAQISSENPFYDIQYAHARSASLLRNGTKCFKTLSLNKIDFSHYTKSMVELGYLLIQWPKELDLIEKSLSIHNITIYLQKLAKKFNSIWAEKDSRWIMQEDQELTSSRLALVLSFKYTIISALAILGIEAYDEMVNG